MVCFDDKEVEILAELFQYALGDLNLEMFNKKTIESISTKLLNDK